LPEYFAALIPLKWHGTNLTEIPVNFYGWAQICQKIPLTIPHADDSQNPVLTVTVCFRGLRFTKALALSQNVRNFRFFYKKFISIIININRRKKGENPC